MNDHPSLSTEHALDELRERHAELAALAGSLAHEIKNPLSVIRMNMDLLAEDFADPRRPASGGHSAKIDMVGRQCTRLENLLNDFLRFNKVSQLDLRLGSLNEQIERVLDLFAPRPTPPASRSSATSTPTSPAFSLAETLRKRLSSTW
jgi:signal transduction histidine kinase